MDRVQTIGGEAVQADIEHNRALLQSALESGKSYSLEKWLHYLEELNPNHMALGLERVTEVARRLHIYSDLEDFSPFVVTVAGTNGKGSTCALIADAARRLGRSVGLFTSPHLLRFNERININGKDISDELLSSCLYEVCQAQYPDCAIESVAESCIKRGEACFAPEMDDSLFGEGYGDDGEAAAPEGDAAALDDASEVSIAERLEAYRADLSEREEEGAERPLRHEVIDLTYFEITTLAAMRAMLRSQCDLLVLEVGLGGRLDAVNAFPNDLAIITSIGLDHMKILGDTTAKIASEKAGIIHENSRVIVGAGVDPSAMREIMQKVKRKGAVVTVEGQDFSVRQGSVRADELYLEDAPESTSASAAGAAGSGERPVIFYQGNEIPYELCLHYPKVPLSCAGIALHALFYFLYDYLERSCCQHSDLKCINEALAHAALPGRMQEVASSPRICLDVAHNLPAAKHLRSLIMSTSQCSHTQGKRRAVVGMLKDKDIEGVLQVLKDTFDVFYVASLHCARGAEAERLDKALKALPRGAQVQSFETVAAALAAARAEAAPQDEITVFGSFVTVAEALTALDAGAR